ncbi:tetratricopeptide repeat protein [Lentilitoribacter sp. EG35]|uniref:tetratricopeptide repeat protein n=1 Tax=Lentilitoribacter sp. EG35 TaxID=3234192 RepID=UPI00345F6991
MTNLSREALNLKIYNPSLQNDDDFLKGFVARTRVAEILFQRLNEIPQKGLASHFLFFGQRGMGKSSMLKRISIELSRNTDLGEKFFPLKFREEQYNIHSLDVFWENCIDSMSDWFEETGKPSTSITIDKRITQENKDDLSPEEFFRYWCKHVGKRPVLLLDNLDIVLSGLNDDEQWALRKSLQDRQGPVIVGASATYMETLKDEDAAFYDFFQLIVLEKLNAFDVQQCLQKIASERGDRGSKVIELLKSDPGRIKTLSDMTGGNPRTLTLLYLLFENDGESDVFSDLENLLDEVTVLYKARVEDLSSQSRVVFDALALNWNPITANDLSQITKLKTSIVTAQLDRLKNSNLIERINLPSSKKAAYQVAERFFNIWYLMRHAPRRQRVRLRWLIEFLKIFYSPKQLTERIRQELTKTTLSPRQLDIFCALEGAIDDPYWSKLIGYRAQAGYKSDLNRNELPTPETSDDWLKLARLEYFELDQPESAIKSLNKSIELSPKNKAARLQLARVLFSEDQEEQAMEISLKLTEEFNDYAPAFNFLGWCSAWVKKDDELTVKYFTKAIEIDATKPHFYVDLARFWRSHAQESNYVNASSYYNKAIQIAPEDVSILVEYSDMLRFRIKNYNEAFILLEKARELSPNSSNWKMSLGHLLIEMPSLAPELSPVKLFKEVRDSDPKLAKRAFDSISYYYEQMGMSEKLIELHTQEIKNNPLHETVGIRKLLGDTYLEELGSKEAAIAEFKSALNLEVSSSYDAATKGYIQAYFFEDFEAAKVSYENSISIQKDAGHSDYDLEGESNLIAVESLLGEKDNDFDNRLDENLKHHPEHGKHILKSIIYISEDNFGAAFNEFKNAVMCNSPELYSDYRGFLALFIRNCFNRQYFGKLIDEFEHGDLHEKYMPLYYAIVALRDGEQSLDEVNPEVRKVANQIYGWISHFNEN